MVVSDRKPHRGTERGKSERTFGDENVNLEVAERPGRLQIRHLLGLEGVCREDLQIILSTAESFKEVLDRPVKKVPPLRGQTVVNLFYEPSTRTRISFELAEKRLSADVVNFTASASSVQKGESFLYFAPGDPWPGEGVSLRRWPVRWLPGLGKLAFPGPPLPLLSRVS